MLDKKTLLKKNPLIALRQKNKQTSLLMRYKKILLIISVILSLLIIGLIYFASSKSNIYRISVTDNIYYTDESIIQLSQLSTSDKYLLTIPSKVEKRVLADPLIEECKVTLKNQYLVDITVKEKMIIGYAYDADGIVLITSDDEKILLDEHNMYLISKVPFIEGFTIEDLILIEKNLSKCDYKVIEEISEIHYYPELKYQNVELIMADGNYIFSSVYGLDILNHYFNIKSSHISSDYECYYFEDISGNAYTSACPWQEVIEPVKEESEEEYEESEEDYDEEYYEEDYEEE